MSHFNSDHKLYKDMRLSQQLHRIEWRETAGEVGALLRGLGRIEADVDLQRVLRPAPGDGGDLRRSGLRQDAQPALAAGTVAAL